MKRLLLLFIPLCVLSAQSINYYTAVYASPLAAAAGATSIQQPEKPGKGGRLIGIEMYSSVAVTFTLEQGVKATATESSAIASVPIGQTTRATLLFFTGSDSPAVAVPINRWSLAAGESKTVMFTEGEKSNASIGNIGRVANANYTVRSSSITGDVKVTWFWAEE